MGGKGSFDFSEQKTDWTDHSQPSISAYIAAVHSSIGYLPNFIMLHSKMNIFLGIIIKTTKDETVTYTCVFTTHFARLSLEDERQLADRN